MEEALRWFVAAEAALPRGVETNAAREKLLNTIAQTRALLAQDASEDASEDEDADAEVEWNEVSDDEDDATSVDEYHDAADDGGWSETDASLADDAYRTAVWLIKTASEEDKPADVELIRDLLERARRFCPPARVDAIQRIDDLLQRLPE